MARIHEVSASAGEFDAYLTMDEAVKELYPALAATLELGDRQKMMHFWADLRKAFYAKLGSTRWNKETGGVVPKTLKRFKGALPKADGLRIAETVVSLWAEAERRHVEAERRRVEAERRRVEARFVYLNTVAAPAAQAPDNDDDGDDVDDGEEEGRQAGDP
jgi:hypothetical protein